VIDEVVNDIFDHEEIVDEFKLSEDVND